jgi:hypothetical protein
LITSYSTLKSAVADYLNRQDLTTVIPTFISLAEKEIQRTLRVRDMLCRSTATISDQYAALPVDFLEMKKFRISVNGLWRPLTILGDKQVDDVRLSYGTTGAPESYALNADALEFVPAPDGEYDTEMTYYEKITPLSDDDTTNWLLEKAPDLYLFGALLQSAPYLKEDERIGLWSGLYKSIFSDIQAESDRSDYAGSTPRVRSKAIG